ncbi:MAG: hypothetical protein GY866_22315 [Proteobacteria bacterium]|nr:hypothetical protein [Pseudomonadota bacterium]
MGKKTVLLIGILMLIGTSSEISADNSRVQGYPKPEICQKSNIRCILKRQGNTLYWCLKSSLQRNLDARRNTAPISKTRLENLGHCAKIIPIREKGDVVKTAE